MNELTLSIDGDSVHTLRGDGIIIGTPTGSTAYLMSTGAPLVTPGVSCIIASPLNEYRFSSRPMILPGEAYLTVSVDHARPQDLMLIIDGEDPIPLERGAQVGIKRSALPTLLMAFEPQFFFRNLRERLNW
jgi:NAD+ kinase